MLTVNQVEEIVGALKDPIIDVPLKETDGIVNVTIKEEIEHVSVKVAMAQLGGQPQLDLQMAIVKALKKMVQIQLVSVSKSYHLKQLRNIVVRELKNQNN